MSVSTAHAFGPGAGPSVRASMSALGRSRARSAQRAIAAIAIGTLMLFAFTVLNGRPTVFSDTDDYFSQGRGVATALQRWARTGKPPIDLSEAHYRLTDPAAGDEEPVHNQDGARSVYYGVFLYVCEALGTLWLLALAQAAIAAALVFALWRLALPAARLRGYVATMAALAGASTLPVFTGFAMPDLFAALAAITTALVVLYADRFNRLGQTALGLLLAFCMNVHGSNLLTCLGVGALSLGATALRGAPWRRLAAGVGLLTAAALVAVLAGRAYGLAVKLRTGDALGRPPFLTARVLTDGPGRDYLRRACPTGDLHLKVCAFRRLPLDDVEDILWSDDPGTGIYNSSDFKTRERLNVEDARFALAVALHRPVDEAGAAVRNWGAALAGYDLSEPLRDPGYYLADPYWRTTTLAGLTRRAGLCSPARGTCALRAPRNGWALWTAAAAAASVIGLGLLAGEAAFARGAPGVALRRNPAAGAAAMLMLAVLVNAAVCGMLSGPFTRYETRMLWLIPLAAALALQGRRTATAADA